MLINLKQAKHTQAQSSQAQAGPKGLVLGLKGFKNVLKLSVIAFALLSCSPKPAQNNDSGQAVADASVGVDDAGHDAGHDAGFVVRDAGPTDGAAVADAAVADADRADAGLADNDAAQVPDAGFAADASVDIDAGHDAGFVVRDAGPTDGAAVADAAVADADRADAGLADNDAAEDAGDKERDAGFVEDAGLDAGFVDEDAGREDSNYSEDAETPPPSIVINLVDGGSFSQYEFNATFNSET